LRLLLADGTVVADGRERKADVLIEGGRITAVGGGLAAREARGAAGAKKTGGGLTILDCSGCLIVAGLVDMHVHLREPGREDEETVASGALAALAGGFTDILAMANTDPVADTGSVIDFVLDEGRRAAGARVHAAGALTKGLAGAELAEMGDMAASGAIAFSDDGKTPSSALMMRHGLEYAKGLGMPVLAHCEEPALSAGAAMNEGITATRLGLAGAPAAAEAIAVAREIALAEFVGTPVHIQHVSTAAAVELVRAAKARGARVTCEVTPHHLLLSDDECAGYDPVYKVNPPLRGDSDREALMAALADGTIDCLASDHAPHARHEKELEFELAPAGIAGLETTLPLVATELVGPGRLSWSRLVEAMADAPRRILGLGPVAIEPGAPADITVIDPAAEKSVGDGWLSKSVNSPWWGRTLKGHARHVIVGGEARLVDGSPR
jgi:dihydroorotase